MPPLITKNNKIMSINSIQLNRYWGIKHKFRKGRPSNLHFSRIAGLAPCNILKG